MRLQMAMAGIPYCLKKYVRCVMLVGILLAGTVTLPERTWAQALKFPQSILYSIVKGGATLGNCILVAREKDDKFVLQMKNFQGLGVTSDDIITTYIFRQNLSLYDTFLQRGGEMLYEMRLGEGQAFDGTTEKVLKFKSLKNTTTEIPMMSSYPIIDLLSSFLVVANRAKQWHQPNTTEPFNLFMKESTIIVSLKYIGPKDGETFQGNPVLAKELVIEYQGRGLFRFYVYLDMDGFSFPIRVKIGDTELMAGKIVF